MKDFISKFNKLIANSRNILITTHISPDDDAIASVSLMREILTKQYNKKAQIYITKGGYERTEISSICSNINSCEDICEIIDNYDAVIFLDGCEFKRFTDNEEVLRSWAYSHTSICIDHHVEMPDFELGLKIIDTTFSSATEAVYTIFDLGNLKLEIEVYKCILLGIMSDTNFLEFVNPNNVNVLKVVSDIIKKSNLSIEFFKSKMSNITYDVYHGLIEYIQNSQIIEITDLSNKKYNLLITYSDYDKDNSLTNDSRMEWIQQYSKHISNVDFACAIAYSSNSEEIVMSFRSHINGVDVSKIANLFQGGGHKMASGAKYKFTNGSEITPSKFKDEIINKISSSSIYMQ